MWAAQYYKFKESRNFVFRWFRHYGFGLPAAMGAKIGKPEKLCLTSPVTAFEMNCQSYNSGQI